MPRRGVTINEKYQMEMLLDVGVSVPVGEPDKIEMKPMSKCGKITIPKQAREDIYNNSQFVFIQDESGVIHLIPSYIVSEMWREEDL